MSESIQPFPIDRQISCFQPFEFTNHAVKDSLVYVSLCRCAVFLFLFPLEG